MGEQLPELLLIFFPALAWTTTSLVLILARLFISQRSSDVGSRHLRAALDRVLGRLFGATFVWSLASGIWLIARFLHAGGFGLLAPAMGAAGAGGVFSLLRNWMTRTSARPLTGGLPSKLRRYLPAALAYLTLGLMGVVLAIVALMLLQRPWVYPGVLGGEILVLYVVSWLWDSKHFGLHEFYSDRIARTYLGASNPDAAAASDNRQTDRREKDDLQFGELISPANGKPQRPIHLVCCAANRLHDDSLGTLGRGSRSAVLSCFGISIGDVWARRPELRLGSALTASAAAFNSNMGSVSRRLGPAVSFLMTALNLRLGLWVRHPLSTQKDWNWLPGVLFFRELFQLTSCETVHGSDGISRPRSELVHLSDGAHFRKSRLVRVGSSSLSIHHRFRLRRRWG